VEVRLVKHNMSGDKNPTRGEIVAAVPLMVRGVTKEHNVLNEARACEEQWQQGSGSKRTQRHEGELKWEGYRRKCGEESEREKR
jgi:hypothetical protein